MATSKQAFVPKVLGLTAFMADNRIDFVIDGPELTTPVRCSAFYDKPKAKLSLDGKVLKIERVHADAVSGEPTQIEVRWGKDVLKLGRRKDATGPVSFYRSLESANGSGPKSAQEILDALKLFVS